MIEVLAVDLLKEWLASEGFAIQTEDRGDGYWVARNKPNPPYDVKVELEHRAMVRYRGGGRSMVTQKLEAVAFRLDALGVTYSWEDLTYPALTVVVVPFRDYFAEGQPWMGKNPLPSASPITEAPAS